MVRVGKNDSLEQGTSVVKGVRDMLGSVVFSCVIVGVGGGRGFFKIKNDDS
jgi:hypothetical protein